jgi:serine/threonine-protein kinase
VSGNQLELAPLRRGDVVDRQWEIEDRLGQGGMGTVFLAQDLKLKRRVAIKFPSAHLCEDAEAMARFEREAQVTAGLDHPNIVQVLAVGRHDGRPYMVMKFLEGMGLGRYVKNVGWPLPSSEVLSIAKQLGAALSHLHSRGLVHRDVKPSNVFVSAEGKVTLLDFGVLHDKSAQVLTRTGAWVGTPAYVAPEVLDAKPIDARADLYSFGVLLYELFCGQLPFTNDNELQLLKEKLSAKAPELPERSRWRGTGVEQVLVRALAPEPDRRFGSAEELLAALELALSRRPSAATRSGRRPPRSRWGLAAAGLVCLAGGALVWSFVLAPEPSAPPEPPVPEGVARASSPPQPAAAEHPVPAEAPTPVETQAPSPPAAPPAPARAEEPATAVPTPRHVTTHRPSRKQHPEPRHEVVAAPADPVEVHVLAREGGRASWALLSVDGAQRGGTPLVLVLTPGHHRLKVERDGFRAQQLDLDVRAGETAPPVVFDLSR